MFKILIYILAVLGVIFLGFILEAIKYVN